MKTSGTEIAVVLYWPLPSWESQRCLQVQRLLLRLVPATLPLQLCVSQNVAQLA